MTAPAQHVASVELALGEALGDALGEALGEACHKCDERGKGYMWKPVVLGGP